MIGNLTQMFPVIKQRTRLYRGDYQQLNTLTPSRCFTLCNASVSCGAASFTTDPKWETNCHLSRAGKFVETSETNAVAVKSEYWTSFIKVGVVGSKVAPVIVDNLATVLKKTSLFGHYAESRQSSSLPNECFDKCDDDFRCAAACFTLPDECRFYKFGFEQLSDEVTSGSTSYVKREVLNAMASMDKLNNTFSVVKSKARLIGRLQGFDTLTPAQCFRACRASGECSAASFTVDTTWENNCFLTRDEHFVVMEGDNRIGNLTSGFGIKTEYWMTYFKRIL
jgi:hypothetical protein